MLTTPRLSSLWRLFVEDDGQDLIEYALLAGAIGFAGAVGWDLIALSINAVYDSWDAGVNSLWEPPDPT